jgi:hypothetical protein
MIEPGSKSDLEPKPIDFTNLQLAFRAVQLREQNHPQAAIFGTYDDRLRKLGGLWPAFVAQEQPLIAEINENLNFFFDETLKEKRKAYMKVFSQAKDQAVSEHKTNPIEVAEQAAEAYSQEIGLAVLEAQNDAASASLPRLMHQVLDKLRAMGATEDQIAMLCQ